ncbi:MAG TPA: hypothetical protein VMW13_04460 [Dehalococcoidales bacterium]|nr:hypothetical protein [Dehalococcoidales bacterium]
MAIDENTRDDGFRNHEDADKEYFAEHNKRMKLFRESHDDWTTTRMTLFNMMVPYDAERNPAETERSLNSIDENYWLTLVPLQGVTERRIVFN